MNSEPDDIDGLGRMIGVGALLVGTMIVLISVFVGVILLGRL